MLSGVVDGDDLQQLAINHPDLAQHLVDGGGGLLGGVLGGLPLGGVGSTAALLAALYGSDGHPVVVPTALTVADSGQQPRSVHDLIEHLGQVSALSDPAHPEQDGTIEIQTLTARDGSVRHIVYLPGTDDMTTLPWTQDGDVRDMATNLRLVAGEDNSYEAGIVEAMHRAGIRPGEPVLLAGHSQGGMEAAALMHDQPDGLDLTNAVTAGSPTAQVTGFPHGSHVLSLEHDGDVVPLLDGPTTRTHANR